MNFAWSMSVNHMINGKQTNARGLIFLEMMFFLAKKV